MRSRKLFLTIHMPSMPMSFIHQRSPLHHNLPMLGKQLILPTKLSPLAQRRGLCPPLNQCTTKVEELSTLNTIATPALSLATLRIYVLSYVVIPKNLRPLEAPTHLLPYLHHLYHKKALPLSHPTN